jgi:arabinofuranosyltransferase
MVQRAWMSDDAFITMRTVDNAVHGYGLRWNVAERVQSFTHPLWALLLMGPYALTREPYFTTLACSIVLSACAAWLVGFRLSPVPGVSALALCLLAESRAFVDYGTSGLENPLAHVLLALIAVCWFGGRWRSPAIDAAGAASDGCDGWNGHGLALMRMSLVAGLLALTRLDLVLLVAPALAVALVQAGRRTALRAILVGAAPVLAWTTFSIVYYGFPFPNTAYAKLNTGVPTAELAVQGLCYLLESLVRDPLTLATCAVCIAASFYSRSRLRWPLAAGIVLYLAYVVRIGGDYMTGRFFTAPFLLAVVTLSAGELARPASWPTRALATLAIVGFLAIGSLSVVPLEARFNILRRSFATDAKWKRAGRVAFRFISDQQLVSGTDLWGVLEAGGQVTHPWAVMGRELRSPGAKIINWGAIGMLGYYGGPTLHILDPPALADPLLARLPAKLPWYPGHFDRRVPDGYLESLRFRSNLIADPKVRAFYELLRTITRDPIWSLGRFRTILRVNLGWEDRLLRGYGTTVRALQPTADGWVLDAGDGVEVWEGGLRLRLYPASAMSRLEIRADAPARYVVRYYRGGRQVAERTLEIMGDPPSMGSARSQVPADIVFDRVDLHLVDGSHPGTVRMLRITR